MRFVLTGLSLLILAGCTVESMPSTPNDGSSSSSSSSGSGGVTSTDAGSPSVAATLPFKASNVTLAGVDASKLGDVVVAEANCTIDTESKLIGCIDNDLVAYVVVDQPGAGKIGMYVAKSVRIEPNAGLRTRGTYALAIVALDSFDVQGKIDASAQSDYESAGGFRVVGSNARGGGEGGGLEGSATNGAGGGSFCGVGGKGAAIAGGTPGAGGKRYGSPSLVPLVGGSAGGSGVLNGGTGGGAVQLVAGKTFTLGASALITVGGGGGGSVGAASNQHGGGGGSGGAILIEAPQATIQGTLLANGGAGGAKATGMDAAAKIDGMRATSDELLHGSGGGEGSGNANDNGSDATWFDGDNAPAGGGGAGRIRVNTLTGNTALSAKVLSPSANGQCTTEGTLAQ
jgi:hypothetical protein